MGALGGPGAQNPGKTGGYEPDSEYIRDLTRSHKEDKEQRKPELLKKREKGIQTVRI